MVLVGCHRQTGIAVLVSARPPEYGWVDDMRSYVFMWRVLVRMGAATAICILMQLFFLPSDHSIGFTAQAMWTLASVLMKY